MIDPSLPLIDLHRHLEGCFRLETLLELARQHHLPFPAWTVAQLRPHVQISEQQPGVMAFLAHFDLVTQVMVNPDACRRLAFENVQIAKAEGIDYFELRFSPWFMAQSHRLNPADVVAAVVEGVQEGSRHFDLPVKLIGILSRTYGPGLCMQELEALLSQKDHIIGLDLAGDEANYPGSWFVPHFRKAREAGWKITAHAGEADGPASIRQAIRDLGASRIGHAVQALTDADLLDEMAQKSIGIECNLTSNVQTSTVTDFAHHPIRAFLELGLLATINSDDPTISAIDLRHEYNVAAPAAGLSNEQICQAQQNALQIAFLEPEEREALVKRVQTRFSGLSPSEVIGE
jgi:adenosine deaminase